MSELTVLYVGSDHCVTVYRNILLIVADSDPQPAFIDHLPQWLKRLRSSVDGPIGFFVVLPPHSDIYVNGRLIGKGRFLQRRVPVGTNTVRYEAPGCSPEEFPITVTSGATVQILAPVRLTCR